MELALFPHSKLEEMISVAQRMSTHMNDLVQPMNVVFHYLMAEDDNLVYAKDDVRDSLYEMVALLYMMCCPA
jgi:hypothetical protein